MSQKSVVSNFLWRLFERFAAQGVSLIVSIILARLLDPNVYGIIALVNVFLIILQVFVDSGLGTALIQKKEADQLDFSSVFYFNICMCIVIYVILFFSAPLIARFYENSDLIRIIRVISITVLVSGVKGIQQAYVSRIMQFKKFFFSTLGGTIFSAVVGIIMAHKGYGVWALVGQSLSNTIVGTVILWLAVDWRPTLEFSFERLKSLLSYGWKILFSSLISTIYTNLRQLLIGKFYTTDDLAYYNKGNEFPNKLVPSIETAVTSVLLPTVAREQNNIENVTEITRRAVKTMTFIIWPMMIGLAACGENLFLLLLTDKWLPAVPYLQLFCIEASFWPISAIYNNASKGIGRSDINLKIQVIVRVIGIVILAISIKWGPFAVAITALVVTLLEFGIVSVINSRLINYHFKDQAKDILPSVCLSMVMGGIVLVIGELPVIKMLCLFIQIFVGIGVYLLGAYLMKLETLLYAVNLLRKRRENRW